MTRTGEETTMRAKGRHDPCVLPRAVPMVESMVALVLVDALMQHIAQCHSVQVPDNLLYAEDKAVTSESGDTARSMGSIRNGVGKSLKGYGIGL